MFVLTNYSRSFFLSDTESITPSLNKAKTFLTKEEALVWYEQFPGKLRTPIIAVSLAEL